MDRMLERYRAIDTQLPSTASTSLAMSGLGKLRVVDFSSEIRGSTYAKLFADAELSVHCDAGPTH